MPRLDMILTAATLLVLCTAAAPAAEVVVIVNEANPVASLTPKQVKGHFLKNPATWADGSRVRPVDRAAADPGRTAFLSQVLDMSSAELERYWISRQYATAEDPPPKARDEAETIQLVDSLEGGIGFVSRKALEGAVGAKIKAVLTLTY